jgi:Predicted permease
LLLGRGLEVPMPVILIGVIGGMIADGLLGLFVGPVVLGVGYVLLIEWMHSAAPGARCRPPIGRRKMRLLRRHALGSGSWHRC